MSLLKALYNAMGAAVASMSFSGVWGSNINSPIFTSTSITRTVTVPSGNPGDILLVLNLGGTGTGNGTPQYLINAGTWTTFIDGAIITVANGDSLTVRMLNVTTSGDDSTIEAYDNTTFDLLGTLVTTAV